MYRKILTGVALAVRFLALTLNLFHQFGQWLGGFFAGASVVLEVVV